MIEGVSVFAVVVVAFVVITVLMGVRQVPQGFNYTVERFGRFNKTLTPGLGLIIPYVDRSAASSTSWSRSSTCRARRSSPRTTRR